MTTIPQHPLNVRLSPELHRKAALAALSRHISPNELMTQATREVVLATLKNAPALTNVARQARRLLWMFLDFICNQR